MNYNKTRPPRPPQPFRFELLTSIGKILGSGLITAVQFLVVGGLGALKNYLASNVEGITLALLMIDVAGTIVLALTLMGSIWVSAQALWRLIKAG